MAGGLSVLWAADGSPYCLAAAESLRRLVLPIAGDLVVLSVPPLNATQAALKQLMGGGEEHRQQEIRKAEEAVQECVDVLGELSIPVRRAVRWGSAAAEIAGEANEADVDLIGVGAKPFNAFRRAIMEDTAIAVVKATRQSVLLARPPVRDRLAAIIIYASSSRWLSSAVELTSRLNLGGKVKVVLANFIEPPEIAHGLFFSYKEYQRLRSEALSMEDHDLIRALMTDAAATLQARGYETEIVIGEGNADQGLSRLAEDVGAGAVVVGATPFDTGFFSSTAHALNAALRAGCSVLVAR